MGYRDGMSREKIVRIPEGSQVQVTFQCLPAELTRRMKRGITEEGLLSLRIDVGAEVLYQEELRTHHGRKYARRKVEEMRGALKAMREAFGAMLEAREREIASFEISEED